jgi:hypothetical protein
LGQLSLADGPVDTNYQSSFDQMFAGVGPNWAPVQGRLFSAFFTSLLNCLSRCRIRSMSGFGVAIPALDFFWKAWIT